MLNILLNNIHNQRDPFMTFLGFIIAMIILYFWFSNKKKQSIKNDQSLNNEMQSNLTNDNILKETDNVLSDKNESVKNTSMVKDNNYNQENEILVISNSIQEFIVNSYEFFFDKEPRKETKFELIIYSYFQLFKFIHKYIPLYEHKFKICLSEHIEKYVIENNIIEKLPSNLQDFINIRYKIYTFEIQNISDGPSIPINIIRNLFIEPFILKSTTMDELDFEKIMVKLIDFGVKNQNFLNEVENLVLRNSSLLNPVNYNIQKAIEYYTLGSFNFTIKKDYKAAIIDFTEAIELNNWYIDAYVRRGFAKSNLEDYNDAIIDFSKVIELLMEQDNEIGVNSNLFSKFNYDDKEETDIDSKIATAYIRRGIVKCKLGDKSAGRIDFVKAKELGNKDAVEMIEKYC